MANVYSVSLDGSTNALTIANDLGITGGNITIEGWFKCNAEIGSGIWSFASQGDAGNDVTYEIAYDYNSGTRRLAFWRVKNGTALDQATYTVTLGNTYWNHIAITYDGTNIRGYFNGKLVAGPTASSGNGAGGAIDEFDIGTDNTARLANIKADDVRVWNTARSQAQIVASMHSQLVGNETNLVAYYKLENNGNDTTANGYNLGNVGTPAYTTDIAFTETNTYSLDLESGSSQYAYVNDNAPLSITGDITTEAWVKFESLPGSGGSMAIVSKFATGQYAYCLRVDESSGSYLLRFFYSNDGSTVVWNQVTWSTPSTGVWYHVTAATDVSAHSTEFFINGGSIGTNAGAAHTSIADTTAQFQVGASAGASPAAYFDGLIDEVRIYNTLLSGAEILATYQTLIDPTTSGLVGYWRAENNFVDLTSNANFLTPVNSPVFSTDVPFVVSTGTPGGYMTTRTRFWGG